MVNGRAIGIFLVLTGYMYITGSGSKPLGIAWEEQWIHGKVSGELSFCHWLSLRTKFGVVETRDSGYQGYSMGSGALISRNFEACIWDLTVTIFDFLVIS
jgi:hypothetical protein